MMFKNKAEAAGYLAGMIDGEGTVSKKHKKTSRHVSIFNTDIKIIEACKEALNSLGIEHSVYYKTREKENKDWKPIYTITVHGKEQIEKINQLPVQCTRKKKRLRELVTGYKLKTKRPTYEELYNDYVVSKLTYKQMANKYKVTLRTPSKWLKYHNILRHSHNDYTNVTKLRCKRKLYYTKPIDEKRAYLAAMLDGEGCINIQNKVVKITSTDKELIEYCKTACDTLNIVSVIKFRKAYTQNCKDSYDLKIYRYLNLKRVKSLPIKSPDKRQKLLLTLDSYKIKKPLHNKEQLFYDYHILKFSYGDLAEKYGVSNTTICYWMKSFNIKARTFSEAGKLFWKGRI